MKRRFGGEPLPVWMPGNSRTAGCGSYVAGGGLFYGRMRGRPERAKKERRQEKSDATLFLYEESGYRKVSCRRIGFDCIGRSADKWGSFVQKKKSAAESVTPEVLVNPQIQQNSAHPSGSGLYLNLQKFTRFQDVNTIVYNTQYVKNACNYGVLHSKGSQFSAICNYLFVLGPGSGTDS